MVLKSVPQLYRKGFWKLDVRPQDQEKAISNSENDEKTFSIGKNACPALLTTRRSGETHLFVQGYKSRVV
ncbi:hypothetical protein TNCV_3498581 [Trichonephila clavipes]|nr:hypothetical protein TNCV_3498581 [Trichonephila clavipes]